MTTNTPLKTNTRWQRDESSEDKKSSTFSEKDNKEAREKYKQERLEEEQYYQPRAKELDDISMVTDLWDLINLNSEMISRDFLPCRITWSHAGSRLQPVTPIN